MEKRWFVFSVAVFVIAFAGTGAHILGDEVGKSDGGTDGRSYVGNALTIADAVAESDRIVVARGQELGVMSGDAADSTRYDGITLAVVKAMKGAPIETVVVTASVVGGPDPKKTEALPKAGETAVFFVTKKLEVIKVVPNSDDFVRQITAALTDSDGAAATTKPAK